MKLGPRDLTGFLEKPDRYRAVLLYGPDEGLIRERRKAILAKVCAGDDPFALTELAGDQVEKEPPRLFEALSAFSLLGSAPSVWLRDAGDKLSAPIKEALGQAQSNFLLVTAGDLPKRSSLRLLFEEHPQAATLPCYSDEAETIERVARSFFARHGIHCHPDVFAYLRQHLGNDRGITLSELEKIALYLGDEKELTAEAAQALVGDNTLMPLDDLAYAVAEGQVRAVHHHTERLLLENHSPITLLRACIRCAERLLTAKSAVEQGKSVDQALNGLRPPVFFKEKDRMKRLVARKPLAQLEQLLVELMTAERQCKRTSEQDLFCQHALARAARPH